MFMYMFINVLITIIVASIIAVEKRYKWIYILYKTLPRDLKALVRFIKVNIDLFLMERGNKTVAKAFHSVVKKYPNKVAFQFQDISWTFKEVNEYSNRIANYFKAEGFERGDVIALLLESRPEYVCFWLGLSKIGVTTALINYNQTKNPLVHSIEVANSKALIYGTNLANSVDAVRSKLNVKLYQFDEVAKTDGAKPLLEKAVDLRENLAESTSSTPKDDIEKGSHRDKLCYIYTSGTTGLPKAAVITHNRFIMMVIGIHHMALIRADDNIYNSLPLYHTAGGVVGIGQTLLKGVTTTIRHKFSARAFWTDCNKYKCTVAQYIGEICRYILAVNDDAARNETVRTMFGNGLRPQIWKSFVDRFGVKEIYEFYGATEGNSNLINIDNTPGCVGFIPRYARFVYPVATIKCDDVTGEPLRTPHGFCVPCKPGEHGILVGKIEPKRAINNFSGYADKSATEKKIIRDVFRKGDMYFNSGDILVHDAFGYYYFKDRTGDTFRWKGENVATSEVEAVISNVVNLNDAVVYGVQIPETEGRAGMAAIVDTENNLDLNALSKGLKEHLPAYAIPIFLRVMRSVPLTGTFKLKKRDLQEDGFDVDKTKDHLYFFDARAGKYVSLTKQLHEDIITNRIRV